MSCSKRLCDREDTLQNRHRLDIVSIEAFDQRDIILRTQESTVVGDPAAAVVEMVYEETSLVKGASAFLGQVREQGKRLLDQSGRSARSTALTVLTRSFVFTGHSSSYSPTSTDKAPVNANELIQVLIEAAHSESLLRSAGAGLVAVMEQAHA